MAAIISERYGPRAVRALVISNMLPESAHPERGRFVRDQVAALRRLQGVEVLLHEIRPGPRALIGAPLRLRRAFAPAPPGPWDVVHAHFGLTAWPALAVPARVRGVTLHGTDVRHPRTRLATAAALPFIDVLGVASDELLADVPSAKARRRARVLPCGVDTHRFRVLPRAEARRQLALEGDRRRLLFPADPARAQKRADRARALAASVGAELLTLGGIDPAEVPLWINAADAVIVTSDAEGFGLAVLEALACDVPVLATPVGIHAEALEGVAGTLCAPFDLAIWGAALAPHLRAEDPRIAGRARAESYSAERMAARVLDAWSESLARSA